MYSGGQMTQTIAVMGTGYVGIVTGTCFAERGNTVTCIDIDAKKIAALKEGKIPLFEPGLEELVHKNVKEKRLFFTTAADDAIKQANIVFICVGTPPQADGSANLDYVHSAVKQIIAIVRKPIVLTIKSTVPVGTVSEVQAMVDKANKKDIVHVAVNPEFLREGTAVNDFMNPDRTVIGTNSHHAQTQMKKLYSGLKGEIIITDPNSAGIIKYASNSFLATKISFINMIAELCEKTNANVVDVAEGMGLDARIGKQFLRAGIGYGGSCFPKDVEAFIYTGKKNKIDFGMLQAVHDLNKHQRIRFVEKIETAVSGLKGKMICVWGLAFKPNTDDIREAPSIDIIRGLQKKGALIKAFDPEAMDNAKKVLTNVTFSSTPIEAAQGADALVLITEWKEFKEEKVEAIKTALKYPVFVDGRNMFNADLMKGLGFDYHSIGRL
jgi:UDPglucose 6-dehydrogenase